MHNVLPFVRKSDTNVISIRSAKKPITPVGHVMTREEQEFFEDMRKTTGMDNPDMSYSKPHKRKTMDQCNVLEFKKS